ncbi:MAG: sugar ABC transporter ATP-binding protein [Planctomycetota bacterium]|nr:sugar ABC transporter ATP-binding protein [Planctomycetota bacterium]
MRDEETQPPSERGVATDDSAPSILEMRGVGKSFGPTLALDGVDLRVRRGEVHALIGENGAGKSTLMKVLSGALEPDTGTMHLDGAPFAPAGPLEARAAGVSMIYQELNLASHLSVEANVLLGMEESRLGFVRRKSHERRVREALELLGHQDIHPRTMVGELRLGARQLVEIARALVSKARIIVLDEPTSSLALRDIKRLFEVVRRLRERGVSVVYISHFLEEVHEVADRYTVLRNGRTAAEGLLSQVTSEQIIEQMVGRSLSELFPRVPHEIGEPLLALNALRGEELPRGVDLELHRGEILGIAGLVGAGRTEMLRAVYGLDPLRSGSVTISGISSGYRRPHQRLAQGVGLLSENRQEEGLALALSIGDNVTLSRFGPISRYGWIFPRLEREHVGRWTKRMSVVCRGPGQPVGDLSGGNQQKIAIARLLHQESDVLLLDEPTKGIDVGSKVEVYRLIGELAAEGRAILFVSSYIPELLGVCDRIAVMSRGRLSAIRAASEWTEHSILVHATAGEQLE